MEELKLTYHNNGKHKCNSFTVSVRVHSNFGMSDVISPTDLVGTGSCYGAALEDFANELNDYIAILERFRDEVVKTTRAYREAVEVDYSGNPLRKDIKE